ncbi:MAG TPA: AAA domain-containing protein [Planctomycetaceae bacterium]|nr:AAA domain-containing protein [Planctomycetaceae bacterium]
MAWLQIEGLPSRTGKGELFKLIVEAGLAKDRVGKIELQGSEAAIEVPDGWEDRLARALDGAVTGNRTLRAWSRGDGNTPGAEHFDKLLRLLDLEERAEADRLREEMRRSTPAQAEASGNSLVDLVVIDENAGLAGRFLVELVRRNRAELRWSRLGVGAPVLLSPMEATTDEAGCFGVVCERNRNSIRVALGDARSSAPDDLAERIAQYDAWRLDAALDQAAGRRQRRALEQARNVRGNRLAELRDVLLGQRPPEFVTQQEFEPLDSSLNAPQAEAVRVALAARDVALIHGPPGTGKTRTVVEVIRQAIRRGERVLACAPSNLGVDNILERLIAADERVVRIGHPARVLPELRAHTLDLQVEDHQQVRVARKLVKEALALFRKAGRFTRARPEPGARREMRDEAKQLLADARRLESQAVEHILDTAAVVCATTTAIDGDVLGARSFDLVVIDEACQSTEPGCWIPLLRAGRVLLAGDHRQLPPTVLSAQAAAAGFGISLFERVMELCGPQVARRLTVQYRMHRDIMQFSSQEFYEGALEADAAVVEHRLSDLIEEFPEELDAPVEFIDTAGAGFDEELEPDGESRRNPREAELAVRKLQRLLDAGLSPGQAAIIAPYAAQVRLLRTLQPVEGLEIDSVDGFQGREKEVVIFSLVRSNPQGEIGFLEDIRRTNVALTRARRKLIVIGDSSTLASDPFYGRLIEYCESIGAYQTIWEDPEFV